MFFCPIEEYGDIKRIKAEAEVTIEVDADTNDVDTSFDIRDGEEDFGGQFNEEFDESGLGTPGASGNSGVAENRGEEKNSHSKFLFSFFIRVN
jgi:hypothetical protein